MEIVKQRDYKFDVIKLFLIILVIYAHIPLMDGLVPMCGISYDSTMLRSMKAIYAFHMPLFVLISGYFTKNREFTDQFKTSIKLLKYFVVFQIVDLTIQYLATGGIPSIRRCISPGFALWYLLCLFYWRLLLAMFPKTWSRSVIVLASIILNVLVGFVPVCGEFSFQRFFSFMPYFIIGHYYGHSIVELIEKARPMITPPILGLMLLLMALILLASSYNPLWLDCIISPYSRWWHFVIRMVFLGYSLVLSSMLIGLFCMINWKQTKLSDFGSMTLLIYLLHPYILFIVVYIWHSYDISISSIDGMLITAIVILILYGFSKVKIISSLF